jgi:hypothetical protein
MNQDDKDTVELTQQLLAEFEGSKATILRIQRLGELELSTCLNREIEVHQYICSVKKIPSRMKTNNTSTVFARNHRPTLLCD